MSIPTDEELLKLASDLEYVGFSTAEFRGRVVDAGWGHADVVKALVTYIMMGNNASQPKRVDRAAKPEVAREMTSWLAGKEVKKNAKTGNPITLGRLAKAYAPALLVLRAKLADKIKSQFETSTPKPQADIAFLGYDNCKQCESSRDYVVKFGLIISKVAFPAMGDTEIRTRNEGFATIAKEGLERDPIMKRLLVAPALPALADVIRALHVKPAPPIPAPPATVGAATASGTPPPTSATPPGGRPT